MNDAEHPKRSAHSETNDFFFTGSPDGEWLYVGPDGAILIFEPEWEEMADGGLVDLTTNEVWEEMDGDDYWGDLLPDWYMRLMTGEGALETLFGGASDE